MKEKIVMIGSGGHALACLDVIDDSGDFSCVGYVDIKENSSCGWAALSYLGDDTAYSKLAKDYKYFCLGVGQIESAQVREQIVSKVLQAGGTFPAIKSHRAYISATASIAEGTVVMHGSHVGPQSKIGRFNILNSKSLIEHGVETEDFVHVSTCAVVNGDVRIGAGSFIGSNSIVRQSLVLPPKTFVQAGRFFNNSSLG